jgi:hypothetical protein
MSLNEATAEARNGTGVSEMHWRIAAIVNVKGRDRIRQQPDL